MVSSRSKEVIGHFLNFLGALGNDLKEQKAYFSRLSSLRWLNNVSGGYIVQVSLLLIGQQGLGFVRYRPLLAIGWRTEQIVRQCRRKMTNTAPNHS